MKVEFFANLNHFGTDLIEIMSWHIANNNLILAGNTIIESCISKASILLHLLFFTGDWGFVRRSNSAPALFRRQEPLLKKTGLQRMDSLSFVFEITLFYSIHSMMDMVYSVQCTWCIWTCWHGHGRHGHGWHGWHGWHGHGGHGNGNFCYVFKLEL